MDDYNRLALPLQRDHIVKSGVGGPERGTTDLYYRDSVQ
jgi:hypothetical protein